MFIAPSSTNCSGDCISMDSFHLCTVSSARLLGVVIDNNLIWDKYVSSHHHQSRSQTWCSAKNTAFFHSPSQEIVCDVCDASRPRLFLLCFCLWSCASDRERLEALERKAIRICAEASHRNDPKPLYVPLRIAPLHKQWLLRVLCAAFSAIKLQFRTFLFD